MVFILEGLAYEAWQGSMKIAEEESKTLLKYFGDILKTKPQVYVYV